MPNRHLQTTAIAARVSPQRLAPSATSAVVKRRRVMFMSEAWVLIAIAPVLYLLSTSGHRGLRLLMFAFIFLVIGDGLLSAVLTRSIRVSARIPSTMELGSEVDVPVNIDWAVGGPVIVHFTSAISSEKAAGLADIDGTLASTATHRGVIDEVTITVAAGAFLGLIGFVTDATLKPNQPMLVVPPAIRHPEIIGYLQSITTATEPDLIGVRPYRPGDRPADVHWPSVARTNEVMVRERTVMPFEPPPLTIVATETSAGRLDETLGLARFATEQAWRSGVRVTLVTHEHLELAEAPSPRGRLAIPYLPPTHRPNPQLTFNELDGPGDLHRALALAIPGPRPSIETEGPSLVVDQLRANTHG